LRGGRARCERFEQSQFELAAALSQLSFFTAYSPGFDFETASILRHSLRSSTTACPALPSLQARRRALTASTRQRGSSCSGSFRLLHHLGRRRRSSGASEKWVLARLRRAFSCRVFRFKVVHINDTNNIEAKIGGSARKIGMQVSTTARVSKLKLGENRSGAVVLRGRFERELRHHPGRRSGWAGRQAERQRLPTQG